MDTCSVCDRQMIYRKAFTKGWTDETKTCKEFELITAHAGCRSLMNKINKLKDELCGLEYQLFCMKFREKY